jgi:hypothetical protein
MMKPWQAEALDQMAQKMCRILQGDPDFADHWVDIAGYASLVCAELKKLRNAKKAPK